MCGLQYKKYNVLFLNDVVLIEVQFSQCKRNERVMNGSADQTPFK